MVMLLLAVWAVLAVELLPLGYTEAFDLSLGPACL